MFHFHCLIVFNTVYTLYIYTIQLKGKQISENKKEKENKLNCSQISVMKKKNDVKSHANHEKHANRQSLPCHVAYKNIYLANPTFFMYTCKVDRCADEEYMYEKTVEIVSLLTPSDTPPFCYPIPFALIGPFPLSLL